MTVEPGMKFIGRANSFGRRILPSPCTQRSSLFWELFRGYRVSLALSFPYQGPIFLHIVER